MRAKIKNFIQSETAATSIEYAVICFGRRDRNSGHREHAWQHRQWDVDERRNRDAVTPLGRLLENQSPAFSPVETSLAPSASASRCVALPGLSGFC